MASRRARGFSLIDGLVASVILGLATVASFVGWMAVLRRNAVSRSLGEAGQIARAEIERAKIMGADNLPFGTYDPTSRTGAWTGAYDASANSGQGGWVASQTAYYDVQGNRLSGATSPGVCFAVQDTIKDTGIVSGTPGGYGLQPSSQREFAVSVSQVSDGAVVFQMATLLVQGGV